MKIVDDLKYIFTSVKYCLQGEYTIWLETPDPYDYYSYYQLDISSK